MRRRSPGFALFSQSFAEGDVSRRVYQVPMRSICVLFEISASGEKCLLGMSQHLPSICDPVLRYSMTS